MLWSKGFWETCEEYRSVFLFAPGPIAAYSFPVDWWYGTTVWPRVMEEGVVGGGMSLVVYRTL